MVILSSREALPDGGYDISVISHKTSWFMISVNHQTQMQPGRLDAGRYGPVIFDTDVGETIISPDRDYNFLEYF